MGREIRRVPPNWKHPTQPCPHSPRNGGCGEARRNGGQCYKPMYDKDYETAAKEWVDGFSAWQSGTHEDQRGEYACDEKYFWEYSSPPDKEYYRPAFTEEPTWYQMYQTVSEGSPVTPPFATKEELVDYLVAYGEFHDQRPGGKGGWNRANAEQLVNDEWAPSLMVERSPAGVTIREPRDGV